jgi:hypothetical protein
MAVRIHPCASSHVVHLQHASLHAGVCGCLWGLDAALEQVLLSALSEKGLRATPFGQLRNVSRAGPCERWTTYVVRDALSGIEICLVQCCFSRRGRVQPDSGFQGPRARKYTLQPQTLHYLGADGFLPSCARLTLSGEQMYLAHT